MPWNFKRFQTFEFLSEWWPSSEEHSWQIVIPGWFQVPYFLISKAFLIVILYQIFKLLRFSIPPVRIKPIAIPKTLSEQFHLIYSVHVLLFLFNFLNVLMLYSLPFKTFIAQNSAALCFMQIEVVRPNKYFTGGSPKVVHQHSPVRASMRSITTFRSFHSCGRETCQLNKGNTFSIESQNSASQKQLNLSVTWDA